MNLPTTMTLGGTAYQYFETKDNDKLIYHGALHSDITRQTLEFIRTNNKRSGTNYGVRRGYIRFTEDRSVTNADETVVINPSVTSVSINFPVGVSDTNAVVIEEIRKVLGVALLGIPDTDQPVTGMFSGTVPEAYDADSENAEASLVLLAAFFEDGQL